MLTCKQITEPVTAYAEGQLRLGDRLRFRLHIGLCPTCRTYVRQLQATARALGRLAAPEILADLQAELLRRFDSRGRSPGGARRPGRLAFAGRLAG